MTGGTGAYAGSIYEALGGEDAVRRLVRRFYELMDTLPEAAACRAIHPASLEGSEQKLFEYLSGWLGGPPLFVDKYGPPMLRRRHFPTAIGPDERDGWLLCFEGALSDTVPDPALQGAVWVPVRKLALHMQNKE
ncbi:MAG: group II truncated hemoglobin [Hyphomicrobiaceae bacterium]